MLTITGTLKDILGNALAGASLVVTLCGYGAAVPRVNGQTLLACTTPQKIVPGADGTFTFQVYGNDAISAGPRGQTYYTVQILDKARNVVQTNAYRFTGEAAVDLNSAVPLDMTAQ